MLQLFLLVILVAVGIGWFLGYRYRLVQELRGKPPLLSHYFLGVNYLLNEQPDQAVEAFIKALEVNTYTAEIYLALGNLFRRQGKLEQAVRVHQTLFSYPNLENSLLSQAYLELAVDYLASGIFNQAEEQLLNLLALNYQEELVLKHLLRLYQVQQEWKKEIVIAKRLQKQFSQDLDLVLEHSYCELAEQSMRKNQDSEALIWLKTALKIKKTSIRANYLLVHLWLAKKNLYRAFGSLKQGIKLPSFYWNELFNSMIQAFYKAGYLIELVDFLQTMELITVGIGLVEGLFLAQRRKDGEDTLYKFLQLPLSLRAFKDILNLAVKYKVNLDPYWQIIEKPLLVWVSSSEEYYCPVCNFSSQHFYWCCPGCYTWESMYRKITEG